MREPLSKLKKGQGGMISELIIEDIEKRRHLLELGLTKGTEVIVRKIAPIGGTISILLRGYELCISKKDASKILIIVR